MTTLVVDNTAQVVASTTRVCLSCEVAKPLDDFSPKQSRCRPCSRVRAREWRAANLERAREYDRQRDADPQRQASKRQTARKLYRADPERAHANSKRWADTHVERRRAIGREAARRQRLVHPERVRERERRGSKASYARRSRAERRLVTERDLDRLAERQGHVCAYCGQHRRLTVDHIIPLVRGGRHAIGNLALACGSCNSSKRDRLLTEWRQRRRPQARS